VQTDLFNASYPSVTVCPISSTLTEERLYRISIRMDDANRLKLDSEVEVDKVQAVWRKRIGGRIGEASPAVMAAVDEALRRWLDI
jgi:mRNA interferase MazF